SFIEIDGHPASNLADDEVEQAVAVPVHGKDGGGTAREENLLFGSRLVLFAVVFDDILAAFFDEFAVACNEDLAGGLADAAADVERQAVLALDLHGGQELAGGGSAEEEDFAGPGAGDDVLVAVAVEVHQLGTKADASARGDAAVRFAGLELDAGSIAGSTVGADILVDPQDAFAELADEEIELAVAVDVGQKRSGVADGGVDRFAVGLEANRRL